MARPNWTSRIGWSAAEILGSSGTPGWRRYWRPCLPLKGINFALQQLVSSVQTNRGRFRPAERSLQCYAPLVQTTVQSVSPSGRQTLEDIPAIKVVRPTKGARLRRLSLWSAVRATHHLPSIGAMAPTRDVARDSAPWKTLPRGLVVSEAGNPWRTPASAPHSFSRDTRARYKRGLLHCSQPSGLPPHTTELASDAILAVVADPSMRKCMRAGPSPCVSANSCARDSIPRFEPH